MRGEQRVVRFGALLALALSPTLALAQAWLPEKGSSTLTASLNDTLNKKHYLPDGREDDVGHTRVWSYGLTYSYALSDRLLVTAGLPYVRTRYWGPRPHPTEIDNGHEHSHFTDFRASLHFQLREAPIALAPYVGIVTPVEDYETLGHAAPGRGLSELWLGLWAGKSLDPWIANTYTQMRYNYAVVERVVGIKHDRSNVDLELGWFATPRFSLRLLAAWQVTHGGIPVPIPQSNPLYPYHDQLGAEEYFNLGGGLAFSLTESASTYAQYTQSLSGRNGHKTDHGVAVGLSYSFAPR